MNSAYAQNPCPGCGYLGIIDEVWTVKGLITMPGSYRYYKCPKCGSLFRENLKIADEELYNESYPELSVDIPRREKKGIKQAIKKYKDEFIFMRKHALLGPALLLLEQISPARYQFLRAHRDRFARGEKVLEIGAAKGYLSFFLKELGVDITAIEPYIPETLRYDNGLIIEKKTIDEINDRYDIIIMDNVFEHLQEPLHVLNVCYDHLNANGVCDIVIPAWGAMTERYRENSYIIQPPEHICIYSVDAIHRLGGSAGFDVVEIERSAQLAWYVKSALMEKGIAFTEYDSWQSLLEKLPEKEIKKLEKITKNAGGDLYHVLFHKR